MEAADPAAHDRSEPRGVMDNPIDCKNEFAAYLEYNKIVRSWFVAFGMGGPALFLINEQLGRRLAESGQLRYVSTLFLVGAGSQVAGAVTNKISNWYVYRGSIDVSYRKTKRYKFFKWWVLQYWVDVLLDISTIASFGLATWQLLTLFGSG
jgi:hypothetical protein